MTKTATENTINREKKMKGFKRFETVYTATLLAFVIAAFSGTVAQSQTIDTLWFEDFEDDVWVNDWHADFGTWEVGVPTSGPSFAYSDSQCAATNLGGDYVQPVNSRFIRHTTFVVPPAYDNPRLRFWHWFSVSSGDYGCFQIRVVGEDWQNLSSVFTGTSSGVWTYTSYDLSEYAGLTVETAFYFHSQDVWPPGGDVSSGWYIDDIIVISGDVVFNNPEDWESGIDQWYTSRGTWQVGEPTSGPGSAYSGLNCAATRLDGNYSNGVNTRLISPPFSVPNSDHNPALRFVHWYSISSGDYGEVQVRVLGDSVGDWTTISGPYTNSSGGWSTPTYCPLSDFAGLPIEIAFYFHSEDVWPPGGDVSSGWYIDSISVQADDLGVITGNVHYQGDPVEDVYVRVVGTDRNALTDTAGTFMLSLIEPGICDVSFSHPEYQDTTLYDVVVDANDTRDLGIIELEQRTGINDDPNGAPTEFTLNQNYPNPFNPTTTVNYLLPSPANVRLEIYNLLGQRVATLCEGIEQAGEHTITWDASGFPSGVYFARLETAERSESIKMLFLK